MNKEELLTKLRALNGPNAATASYDQVGHEEADDLLLEFTNDPEIEEAYHAILKSYSG